MNETTHLLLIGEHLKKNRTFVRKYLWITGCQECGYITDKVRKQHRPQIWESLEFTQGVHSDMLFQGCLIYFYLTLYNFYPTFKHLAMTKDRQII